MAGYDGGPVSWRDRSRETPAQDVGSAGHVLEHLVVRCNRLGGGVSVRKLLDLSGKAAIVTGGSRGIGLQLAEGLGEMGARVAITARKQGELDEARVHLEGQGVECLAVAADLASH